MQQIIILLVVLFVGYRIAKRIKGNFSWTELRAGRLKTRILLFAVIGAVFLAEGGFSAIGLVSDIVGVLIGATLGVVGASMTSFEQRGAETFYKANVWIGSFVTALFIGRFAYRFYEMYDASRHGGLNKDSMNMYATGSSWTSGLMLIMFAYYIVYYFLLMRHRGRTVSSLR